MICTHRTRRCHRRPSERARVAAENVTHGLLQQLLQAVDVRTVPSLPLHHHAVSVTGDAFGQSAAAAREGLLPSATHMSGEWTVFTCPAYSSWSSIGIKTLSPSTRESLSSTHCTGAEHQRDVRVKQRRATRKQRAAGAH